MPITCDLCGPDIAYEGHKLALPNQDGGQGMLLWPSCCCRRRCAPASQASAQQWFMSRCAANSTRKTCSCGENQGVRLP